jgi:hypothetical protein
MSNEEIKPQDEANNREVESGPSGAANYSRAPRFSVNESGVVLTPEETEEVMEKKLDHEQE